MDIASVVFFSGYSLDGCFKTLCVPVGTCVFAFSITYQLGVASSSSQF